MAYTYNYSLLIDLLEGTMPLSTESVAEQKQAVTEITKQIISVVDSTAAPEDVVISLGGVETAKTILIKSTQTVSIKFNTLEALSGKVFFIKGAAVEDITVCNTSGSTAILTVLLTD